MSLTSKLTTWLLGFAVCLAFSVNARAQFEDEEFARGLLARYSAGDRSIQRVDLDLSYVWDAAAPDPRLPVGRFRAAWNGTLLIREPGNYRFHAYLQGEMTVELAGTTVLSGGQAEAGWLSGPATEVEFGETPLSVTFRKTEPEAQVRLFWSSDRFHLEPIPPFLLFHADSPADVALVEHGRRAFDAYRCNRCHRRAGAEPSAPAPALTAIRGTLDRDWIVEKLSAPPAGSHERMPAFGFRRDEAQAIAAYLLVQANEPALEDEPESEDPKGDRRRGEALFRSLGCLACHRVGQHGAEGLYAGGDLSAIGSKRTTAWVLTWLERPADLNSDHRMPVFDLSEDERRQLALHLSSLSNGEAPVAADEVPFSLEEQRRVAEGQRLVEAARCAACHRIDGLSSVPAAALDLSRSPTDWRNSCLAENADRETWRPMYNDVDVEVVRAYVDSIAGELSAESDFDVGARLLEQRNCLACHQRDGRGGNAKIAGSIAGFDDELRGQSEALIPPALTAIGDKLHDKVLNEAIRGEQKKRRMPWLQVRMPRFVHNEAEQTALVRYLVEHDRVPDDAPSLDEPDVHAADDATTLVAGHALVGAKGFSCVACHEVGEYKPRNVALGTRGSDLLQLGQRMRREFYLRWTRSPLRIEPGMEMPSYEKAVPGVLNDDVESQLLATWQALNDPRFTPPANPGSVEQYWTVAAGAPARIVRDVFTNKGGPDGHVARSLVIGLHNGHNLLFDLDRFALRQWRFGDLALQRTEGKSWYWDMAGVPILSGLDAACDLALVPQGEAVPVFPAADDGRAGRLRSYRQDGLGLTLEYELTFNVESGQQKLDVTETISPAESPASQPRAGWDRRIIVSGVPAGYDLLVASPTHVSSLGDPRIEPIEVDTSSGNSDASAAKAWGRFLRWTPATSTLTVGLRYTAVLPTAPIELKPVSVPKAQAGAVTSVPGFEGVRLPIETSIMPTAMAWTADGTLAFTSLKGHVYLARDTDGDGLEDTLTVFEEGLAAPYGIIADGSDLIVSHKPELLRLRDTDGDGRADVREVVADGWGYTDNYHDWTCGIVRDKAGNLYVGLGSDYSQAKRPEGRARWRGKVLQIDPTGYVTPIGHAFRYPTGLAIDAYERIFVSDNQGVQNTFNEVNYLLPGRNYGVPSRHEEDADAIASPPAIQVPHPWTRSVNGLFFLPQGAAAIALAGHGIGCEYDSRFLVRFTTQQVGDDVQGAVYAFSRPEAGTGSDNFLGPLCGGVAPDGSIYIGGIHDSGWLGGQNTGEIVRLRPGGPMPNGMRELRLADDALAFEIDFFQEVDRQAAAKVQSYTISGYTRVWEGAYATADSGRHSVVVDSAQVSADGRSVKLFVDALQEGYVYEVTCGKIAIDADAALWPATGHYTLNRMPRFHDSADE